jgi:hypothetical protein
VNSYPRNAYENDLVERDVAEILYGQGVGGLFVTAVASTAFVMMLSGLNAQPAVKVWLTVMLLSVLARALDLVAGRKRRLQSDWNGRT